MQGKIIKKKVYVIIPVELEIYCAKDSDPDEKFKKLEIDVEKDFTEIYFWSVGGLGTAEQKGKAKIVSELPIDK